MAQEIQRKLEETEVKQRDLESRGVSVEKALRGEEGIYNIFILYIIMYAFSFQLNNFFIFLI